MYLPADHKCAIRQGFVVSLLLTPLFFSGFLVEFLGSNEEGMWVKALYRAGGPCRPRGGRSAPLPPSPRAALPKDLFVKKNLPKGPIAPCLGDRGNLSPPSSDWGPHPQATRGPVAPPRATGSVPLYKPLTPFPPHLSPKIPLKIQKKRGEEKGSGEVLPDCALVICR